MRRLCVLGALCWVVIVEGRLTGEERYESFDRDPQWEGFNNRATQPTAQTVRQDFGYSPTHHAQGSAAGEIGGWVTPAAEPAYYGCPIARASLDQPLWASGKLIARSRQFHVLIGFFNSRTANEWRTANTVALRLYGRGDVFYAYVEYATSRWRAGGDEPGGFATELDPVTNRPQPMGFARDVPHHWSLSYDPHGNQGKGSVTVRVDDQVAVCHLADGHKKDGASFDRFGLMAVAKHFDQGGEVWLDDVTINGQQYSFDRDPQWEGHGNRNTYVTYDVRPRFDFGYSNTWLAGGQGRGELGGLVFRGDIRYRERIAYYADRIRPASLAKPLRASGRVSLRRAVSDSTTLLGFFHSETSTAQTQEQHCSFPRSFVGIAVEGPSREGFFVYPVCRLVSGDEFHAVGPDLPHILPDGISHDWTMEYQPPGAHSPGKIIVTFDGRPVTLALPHQHDHAATQLNRFGIITTWLDGNGQRIYFDDLRYTCRQE